MTLKKTFLKSLLNSLQYYFYVLFFWPRGMWDLSSPTRGQTPTICIGSRVVTTGPPGKSLNSTLDIIYQLPSIMVHANLFSDSIPSYLFLTYSYLFLLTILHLLNIVIIFGQINIQYLYYQIYANVTPSRVLSCFMIRFLTCLPVYLLVNSFIYLNFGLYSIFLLSNFIWFFYKCGF